jgi:hypothetical protein
MSDDDLSLTDRVPGIVEGATSAVIAAGTALATPGAVAAGGLAILPLTLGKVLEKAIHWKQAEAARLWKNILRRGAVDGATEEEIAGLVEAHAEEPFVRETISRSVKAVLESVDPCVVVPLAAIAAECLRKRTPPDAHSRATIRLLCDLGREDLSDLQVLVSWVLKETTSQSLIQVVARDSVTGSGSWQAEVLRDQFVGTTTKDPDRYAVVRGLYDLPRLFHSLKACGLASDSRGVSFVAGPQSMVITRDVATRLERIVRLAQ